MANRLANETSLYLRQHAENPVDWHPWGEEALEKARRENKPLLVSVGYSSCHWCHVMAHESFENEYIATLMNKHFVCVKVDREERPDVDQIYMEAVQMITQHGGWPLNAFCLPDGRPFFGGTYFPPEDRGNGMIPWPQLLMRVSDFYQRERDKLEENAASIVHNLGAMNAPFEADEDWTGRERLLQAGGNICRTHDDDFGGFGEPPKFPPSMSLSFLLELRRVLEKEDSASGEPPVTADRLDQVITATLSAMAHGGLFDQIGGGFTRYSVDRYWLIPHFEKMLYDNGLLLDIYARAWRRYGQPLYRAIVEETVEWGRREMLAPNGLFYASLDADSEGEEGKFYVWTPDEVKAVLGEERGKRFCTAYGVTPEGNFEHGKSNPALVASEFAERQEVTGSRAQLLEAREQRVRPGRDEKHLVSWNSLFIRGLAEAAFTFDRPDYYTLARNAAEAISEKGTFDENRLHAVIADTGRLNGYLDDYAFYAEALLSLGAWGDFFDVGSSGVWIDRARRVADSMVEHFADPEGPGFYFTSHDHERLVSRRKEWWDNAIPSGQSCLLHIFSSLYSITGDGAYARHFDQLRRTYSGYAQRAPSGVSHGLAAVAAEQDGIGVIKVKGVDDWKPLAALLRERPWQRLFVLETEGADQPDGYQFCAGPTCLLATTEVEKLREQL